MIFCCGFGCRFFTGCLRGWLLGQFHANQLQVWDLSLARVQVWATEVMAQVESPSMGPLFQMRI